MESLSSVEVLCASSGLTEESSKPCSRGFISTRQLIDKLKHEQRGLQAVAKKGAHDILTADPRSKRVRGNVSGFTDGDQNEILCICADVTVAAVQRAQARPGRSVPASVRLLRPHQTHLFLHSRKLLLYFMRMVRSDIGQGWWLVGGGGRCLFSEVCR